MVVWEPYSTQMRMLFDVQMDVFQYEILDLQLIVFVNFDQLSNSYSLSYDRSLLDNIEFLLIVTSEPYTSR